MGSSAFGKSKKALRGAVRCNSAEAEDTMILTDHAKMYEAKAKHTLLKKNNSGGKR